ncbi:MAG: hypothetical protein C5B50_22505 [Verrucomicrobia bacterium]|nr:MAG: hypothetical protein C5B50_22505 [Verrucomicrobiota bacterium]
MALAAAGGIYDLRGQTLINVTQHHNHASRDGLYIEPAFTQAAVTNLQRDLTFAGTISGNVYAQPLYLDNGPGGKAAVIAVTESNNVYALDAANASVLWQRNVGSPIPLSHLPCGNIDPMGITGTPVVDLPSRTLFFDAMTTPNGTTARHLIYALNLDTGTTNSGWPVDVNASATFGTNVFTSQTQGERSALSVIGGSVYVPYGGLAGDCGTYHGWLVGVTITNPAQVTAWATTAGKGGAWACGGAASDGTHPFLGTGNTSGASSWSGGEAIIRFQPGPVFSGQSVDYWAPANWMSLDTGDMDIGGSGPVLINVPGATPPNLVVALGKDGNAYLLNATNLGGVSVPVAQAHVSTTAIIQAAATYRTALGTYVVFCGNTSQNQLTALRITVSNPPTITNVWTQSEGGRGSPFVTSTDGTNNVIVWGIGCEGDQRLHGFDGDTGRVLYSGGGTNELMAATRRFSTGIAAHGRIFVAADKKIYAFSLPVSKIVLTNLSKSTNGPFQFGFTNTSGMRFEAFATTNMSVPFTNWASLGAVPERAAGQYQIADLQATNGGQRFYRVRWP